MVFPQPLLIVLVIIIPIFCLFKKRHDILVSWLSITMAIDIFNSQKYMNLTAFKLAGLVLIPYILLHFKTLLKSNAFKILLIFCGYHAILGLYFGHINPWIDPTGLKSGRDVPQWRSIIFLGSMALELSSMLYFAIQFRDQRKIILAIKTFIASSLCSSIAAQIELITQFDFYAFFTAKEKVYIPNRMKGFNYEPRGFAQTSAYSIILSSFLILFQRRWIYLIPILAGFYSTLVLTFSATGVIILLVGIFIVSLVYVIKTSSFNLKKVSLGLACSSLILSIFYFSLPKNKISFISSHIKDRSYLFESGSLIDKLEVFDGAAVNFLTQNPKYLLFGTGPGLVSIPVGTKYILDKDIKDWSGGLVALPHMGLILLISNVGIVGLALWLAIFLVALKDLREKPRNSLLDVLILFTLSILYLLQVRLIFYFALSLAISFKVNSGRKIRTN